MDYSIYRLLLCLCCAQQVITWRSFTFQFTSVHCAQKSDLLTFLNCTLAKSNGSHKQGLSMSMKFARDILRPRMDFIIMAIRNGHADFALVNLTDSDSCGFLDNTGRFNLLQILRNEFEKYGQLPTKCPVAKGTEIHIKNFILDPEKFPPYVPQASFSAVVNLREKITPIFELNVNGSVNVKNRIKKQNKN